jgi:chromate reductase, NAD(P)H dehydrogenase (quinone)
MSSSAIHLVGFSGSLRKASLNTALLRAAGTVLPSGVTFEVADLAAVPLFNGDLIEVGAGGVPVYPEAVAQFRAAITRADALLIVSPEYNFSMPAVTKNAIDWASRAPNVLDDKAVAFTGASPGAFGTIRSQMALRQTCVFTNLHAINTPELFVSKAADKFDASLALTDEPTREALRKLVESLVAFARRLRAPV